MKLSWGRLVCAVFFACVQAPHAWAHAKLVRSDPSARAVLARAPATIQLWFNEKLEPAYSSAELRDGAGAVLSTQKAIPSPSNAKQLVLKIPSLADGDYIVRYRVLSVDGHIIESEFRFSVRAKKQ
ncbi:MAG: copper resistance protein CopC [Burkholderiales bacterium]